jgi:hypothetical protein
LRTMCDLGKYSSGLLVSDSRKHSNETSPAIQYCQESEG